MPTYEYECSKGHLFEVEQAISADPLKRCKLCRAKVRRLISASHFILKGSGWYADGYGSSKPKSGGDSKSESKSEAKSETKSESKSESKPAAAPAGGDKSKGSAKPGSGSSASAGT